MKVVIATDSFKGCCTTLEAAQAIASGVRSVCPDALVHTVMVADGGEGTMHTLVSALGGTLVHTPAHDALMRPLDSVYGLLPDGTAVLDMAQTGGLALISPSDRRPMDATSYGLGEQIADAIRHGCCRIVVGIGGSATTDGGRGMLSALEDVDCSAVEFRVLTDVNNPLYGPNGAAHVFSPQKGASPLQVLELDDRLRQWATQSPHPDRSLVPGAGAAGGLGFGFLCWLNATLTPGINEVLRLQHVEDLLPDADLVITGEGKMDAQTLMNKAPLGVLRLAERFSVPVVGFAGRVDDRDELIRAGFRDICCINPPNTPLDQAMQPAFALRRLELTAAQLLDSMAL